MDELLEDIHPLYERSGNLCITGGEPLMQEHAVKALVMAFPQSWIETSGIITFDRFVGLANLVVDFKPKVPIIEKCVQASMEEYLKLTTNDWIKFIIRRKEDFNVARAAITFLQTHDCKARLAFAPVNGEIQPSELVAWMYEAQLSNAVLNIQLHKYVGLQ